MTHLEKQIQVYTLAFVTYFGFYVSREPYSLVKATLLASWYPFDGPDGWILVGLLDTIGLAAYAVGIFIVGYLSEKFDSLHVLVVGCFGAGVTTILYGMANFWNIHNYWYFVTLRILNGLFEAGGWPTLIKMLDHYFCMERKRDFILTAFGACKFLGIIAGCIISSFSLSFDNWGYCFIWCGLVIIVIGIVDMMLLPNLPPDIQPINQELVPILSEESRLKAKGDPESPYKPTSPEPEDPANSREVFIMALKLPGILDYAFHLFFVKLSVYILYYWLPTWLVSVAIDEITITYVMSCYYTALWAFGGVIGTLLIGWGVYLSRQYGILSGSFSLCSGVVILLLYWYSTYRNAHLWVFLVILVGVGVLQMGPYSLASACIPSVINALYSGHNAKLVGMAVGIIDGIGSIGAIFGPLSGALILQYTNYGWGLVFLLVAISMFMAFVMVTRQIYLEVKKLSESDDIR